VSEHDVLRSRIAALGHEGEVPAWVAVQARAARLHTSRTRQRRLTLALVLAGALILALPTPGLGGRLVDVIADRDARPALQQYLARFSATPDFGTLDASHARELIDADTARGKVTLFEVSESGGSRCIGFYADWLDDPGIGCGYRDAAPGDLSESLLARLDPHVIAVAGVAPAAATSVRLAVDGATSTSPTDDGFFFVALDPATLGTSPVATITALAADGTQIASHPLDLAGFLAPVCDQRTPGHLVSTVDVGSEAVEIHEAQTATRHCYWLDTDGLVEGIFSGPLNPQPYRRSSGPGAVLNIETLPSGAQVLWGQAAVPAVRAVVHLVDGTDENLTVTDRYLVVPLAPATTAGKRPTRIELFGADGSKLSSQAVDPDQPSRLIMP
jgi:hypothetical protein